MTNIELINNFVKYLEQNNKSKSTIIAYKKDLEQIELINQHKNFSEYTSNDIKSAVNEIRNVHKLTLKTISRKINSIRSFFKFLLVQGYIQINVGLEVTHPKYRNKKPRVLNQTEYLALKEVSRENYRMSVIIELLLQTGLRISELSKLEKKDVFLDVKKPYILVRSYSSTPQREVPLNHKISRYLKEYINKDKTQFKPLFSTKTGKPIEIRNIRTSIDKIIMNAKIKNACVNDLRNTFIVYQLTNGMSIDILANIVGHKNINTTLKYTLLLPKKYQPNGINEVAEL